MLRNNFILLFLFVPVLTLAQTDQNQDGMHKRDWDTTEVMSPYFHFPPEVKLHTQHEPALRDSNVTLLGRWAWGNCYAVDTDGEYAYIGNGGTFQVLDLSDPSSPQLVAEVILPDLVINICVSGDYAYVSAWTAGLRIIDISDPKHPLEVSFYDEVLIVDVAVSENYAFAADASKGGLRILDVSLPSEPKEEGHFQTTGVTVDIEVSESYAYLAELTYDEGWFTIVDISTPPDLQQEVSIEIGEQISDLAVSTPYVYIAADFDGLHIFQVSDPTQPSEVSRIQTQGNACGIVVSGNYAYVRKLVRVCRL